MDVGRRRAAAILAVGALALTLLRGREASARAPAGSAIAAAKAGEVRVFVSGALKAPLEAARDEAQAAIGRTLVFRVGQSRVLQAEIEAGQPFEVALLAKPVIDEMIARGEVALGSETHIARVPLTIGVRGAVSKADVGTPEALRKTLLGAKAIRRFFGVGASVPGVEHLLNELEVQEQLRARMIALGVNQSVRHVPLASGEYELVINLSSEVLSMNGWTYLGPVPAAYQLPVLLSAGVGSKGDVDAAAALISFLKRPAFERALRASGMSR